MSSSNIDLFQKNTDTFCRKFAIKINKDPTTAPHIKCVSTRQTRLNINVRKLAWPLYNLYSVLFRGEAWSRPWDHGGSPMAFIVCPHFQPDGQSWSLCNVCIHTLYSRPYRGLQGWVYSLHHVPEKDDSNDTLLFLL